MTSKTHGRIRSHGNKVQGLDEYGNCGALFYEFIGYHEIRRSKHDASFDRQWMMRVYKSLRFPGNLEDLLWI